MPGISVSKICVPFGGGGINWSSYWATLISATVENAAPTHVVLTFPTAQTSLGASDFTIAGFTISSVSWTGAVLTLVLSIGVKYGDALIVTFVTTGETANVTNNVGYYLYDTFATSDAAPVSSPRNCEPIGTFTITDTGNKLSITGAKLVASGAQTSLSDPKLTGIDRQIRPGVVLYSKCKGATYRVGYKDVTNPANPWNGLFVSSNNVYQYEPTAYKQIKGVTTDSGTTYEIATITRSNGGGITFIKGGAFSDWTLLAVGICSAASEAYSSHIHWDVGAAAEIDDLIERPLYGIYGKSTTYANLINYAAIANNYSDNAASADCYIEFSYKPSSAEVLNVMFRRTDDDNCWIMRVTSAEGGGGTIEIIEKSSGSETQRAVVASVDTRAGIIQKYYIRCHGNGLFVGGTESANRSCNYSSATFNTNINFKFTFNGTGTVDKVAVYDVVYSAFSPLTVARGTAPIYFTVFGDSKTATCTWPEIMMHNIEDDNDIGCYHLPLKHGAGGSGVTWWNLNIASILSARNNAPDYVCLNLGVNDVDYVDKDAWELAYLQLCDTIHTKWPNAKIYCMLVWFRNNLAKCNVINAHIVSAISKRSFMYEGPDERIWLEGGDDGATMTSDGTHYSAAGEIEAAAQWQAALGY